MTAYIIVAWLKWFLEKPSWCRNEQVCQGGSVKHFEWSNRLDNFSTFFAMVF